MLFGKKLARKILGCALAVVTLLASVAVLPAAPAFAANPYLPLWEHLPDGEPRVFEDPENPGKYRAYIYGSHDVRNGSYCGPDIRSWSAPVDDLLNWRDEGSVFKYFVSNQWDVMYAPDIVEVLRFPAGEPRTAASKRTIKEYYLYPHSRGGNRIAMVCKGPSPVGPFEPINMNATGTATVAGSLLGFDPAVWIEYIDDPADPDYSVGFRAYAYWGYAGDNTKSRACQLNPDTMYSLKPGTSEIMYFMPCSSSYGNINDPAGTTYPYIYPDENLGTFNFFEASSIRKVGNKYIMIYSGYSGPDYGLGSSNSALRYCYGDTPLGPWRSGGVLVDSRAVVQNETGTALATTFSGHNTHGSLCEINGQWYIYYHRAPRGFGYMRQPMVAPVKITWEETSVADHGKVVIRAYDPYSADNTWTATGGSNTYTGAEVTSEGFEIFGLDPYKYYSAGIACYLSNTGIMQDSADIWDNHMPLTNVANGNRIGFKYFGFGGLASDQKGLKAFEGTKPGNNTKFNLYMTPRTANAFSVQVWLDGPWNNSTWKGTLLGTINVPAGSSQETDLYQMDVSSVVDNLDGKHSIFLVAAGGTGNLCDILGLGFSSDTKKIDRPVMPTLGIAVNGTAFDMPTTPIRSTNANGITGYDIYRVAGTRPAGIPTITAAASDPDVKVIITQPNAATGNGSTGIVRFIKDGITKTYRLFADTTTNDEQSDVDAILAVDSLLGGRSITVKGTGSETPEQKIASANAKLAELVTQAGVSGLSYKITHVSGEEYTLQLSRGYSGMLIPLFSIDVEFLTTAASIEVGGAPIEGFSPGILNYNLYYDFPRTGAPVVTATASAPEYTVNIVQASAVPGIAKVTVSGKDIDTGEPMESVYNINFRLNAPKLESIGFNGGTIQAIDGVFEYDANVPNSKTNISVSDLLVNAAYGQYVDANIAFSPADGSVRKGAHNVATVTLTYRDDPAKAATYKINLGYLTAAWKPAVNNMGYNSYVDVRFGDGVTGFKLVQGFYEAEKLAMINSKEFPPLAWGASASLNTSSGVIKDEYLRTLDVKEFLWDQNFVPILAEQSTFAKPFLSSISVGGVPLTSFSDTVYGYTYGCDPDAPTPVVAAEAAKAFKVSVTQADSISGKATITVSSKTETVTYTVALYDKTDPTANLGSNETIAFKGTPTDYQNPDDPIWSTIKLEIPINKRSTTDGSASMQASGKAKVLWDENYLYARVEVIKNYALTAAGNQDHLRDSVELFFSENNVKNSNYGSTVENGNQYRVGYNGALSQKTASSGWGGGAKTLSGLSAGQYGYVVTYRIPWVNSSVPKTVGAEFGLDFQINAMENAAARTCFAWCDGTDSGYNSTMNWGTLTLY